MLFYTTWIILNIFINNIDLVNNINLINNIGSIIISTLIKETIHKYIFLILYITNIINDNNLFNLIINFYIIFVSTNIWDIFNSQIKINNTNNNTNIDINFKQILNNIDESYHNNDINLKKEILVKNTEKINYFIDDDNKKFNYYLENSMIII
jgi:hypothetical protein